MLKPNATRVELHQNTADLVAKLKANGGVIVKVDDGVAKGLKKRKYVRR